MAIKSDEFENRPQWSRRVTMALLCNILAIGKGKSGWVVIAHSNGRQEGCFPHCKYTPLRQTRMISLCGRCACDYFATLATAAGYSLDGW